ncbi:hypothetical protein A9179_04610 [Pseudomonas alcaligenes]|uniref:Lipoprotein n=1 Tax=Aquipseudomonas alcaligenes TaxID=43263 RepID=A0ABR7RYJ7_AQUAC|nr:hypothetical protein [Pseudomonas alcaligenes]
MSRFTPVAWLRHEAIRSAACLTLLGLLAGCASRQDHAGIVANRSPAAPAEFFQTHTDRIATIGMRNNLNALYRLMDKLYLRNPREWRKSGQPDRQAAERQVQMAIEQSLPLGTLGARTDVAALSYALSADYQGDRVGAFIYALGSMLVTAHGGRTEFYMTDELDPQFIHNAARNVERAAWLLASRNDLQGNPWLLSNEISGDGRNLSFAVEFGKIVARLDLLTDVLDERYRRLGVNYAQSLLFMNFLPVQ